MPSEAATYYELPARVKIVTEHRGLETFQNSRELFTRLAELPDMGGPVLQLSQGEFVLSENSVAALNEFLRLPRAFVYFGRATRQQPGPARAPATRWSWAFLGQYLGFDWRPCA